MSGNATQTEKAPPADASAHLTEEQRRLAVRRGEMEAITEKEMAGQVFNLAWPATLEAVLQTTIRMVTSSLLGHIPGYSSLAISATGLADRVTRLSWCMFAAVGTGATVMVARNIGAGDPKRANRFAAHALLLGAALTIIITALLIAFPQQLINGLYNRGRQMDAGLVIMAIDYLRLTAWSVPFMAINQVISAVMRGAGNTKVTLITNTTANVVNAILGYALIYGNFGAPVMGVTGAAVATVISQGVGAAIALFIFFKIQTDLRVSFKGFRIRWEQARAIFGIGVPHASEQLLMQFGQIALAGLIGSMGATQLAAHTQGIIAESLSYMPAMGFSIASTTLVGMSIGVGSEKLVRRYVNVLVKWDLVITGVTASILIFAPRQVFSLLSNDSEVIALGAVYLLAMGFCQFPQQLTGVFAGALRGAGDSRATLLNSLIGLWIVRVPLSFVFANALEWGIYGVWGAMALDLVTRFVLTIVRYKKGKWRKAAQDISGSSE